jgi:hypothetical protein
MSNEQTSAETLARDANNKVNDLLHDADCARWGAKFAAYVGDTESANRLTGKNDALLAEARAIDPERRSMWWSEWGKR